MTETFYDRIRAGLSPHVRAFGVNAASRATEIEACNIRHWMAGRRGMSPKSVELLAKAVGARVVVRVEKAKK